MSETVVYLFLIASCAVNAAVLTLAALQFRRNRAWINKLVAMQNVSLYLYNRLEMIDHNIHHHMRTKGPDTLDELHRMAQHHAEQRNDVTHVAYNGLIFIDPVTKDEIL